MQLTLGKHIVVLDIIGFDGSIELEVDSKKINVSREVAKHLLIKI